MAKSFLYSFARRRAVDAAIDFACGDVDDEKAFRRLVESVRFVLALQFRAPRQTPAAVPFGPHKGQSLATLADDELRRLEAWARRALEAEGGGPLNANVRQPKIMLNK